MLLFLWLFILSEQIPNLFQHAGFFRHSLFLVLDAGGANSRRRDHELHIVHIRVARIDERRKGYIRAGFLCDHIVDLLVERVVDTGGFAAEFFRTVLHFLCAVPKLIDSVRVILQTVVELLHIIQRIAQIGQSAVCLAVLAVFLQRLGDAVQILAALALIGYLR